MSDPLFDSTTPHLTLPLLFPGQSQKELFVNESFSRIDAAIGCIIEGTVNAPPASPQAGQCWLVGPEPTGAWHGQAGRIAAFQGGHWLFLTPCDGWRLMERASGQDWRYLGGWRKATLPPLPAGGTTVDTEARGTLAALIDSLIVAGILAQQ